MTASTPHDASDTGHIGTHQHYRWLEGIVKVTLVLNLLDALFTLLWVRLGLASEANPILAELVETRPVAFVATKLLLVGMGSLLLWRLRHRPLAVVAMFLAFLAYYGILLLHVDYLGYVMSVLLSA